MVAEGWTLFERTCEEVGQGELLTTPEATEGCDDPYCCS